MKTDGWVKLHRKILENPYLTSSARRLAMWVLILLKATHQPHRVWFQGVEMVLEPGSFITGSKTLGAEIDIPYQTIHRILDEFERENLIEMQTTNKNRLIKVKKWHEYQDGEKQSEKPMRIKRETSENPVRTNKKEKNIKNEKKLDCSAQTPVDASSDFFGNPATREATVQRLVGAGKPEDAVRREVEKFVGYWTEPNKSGTRQRWQMEKTFEVNRRLDYWLGRSREFERGAAPAKKPRLMCSGDPCFIDAEGRIKVKAHDGWKDWGGIGYDAFSYGDAYGYEAVRKARAELGIAA